MDKKDILKKFSFYNKAGSMSQKELEQNGMFVSLKAGEFYFHEGDACRQIAIVGEGNIRVYKTGETGKEITLYHVRSGETCILTASCVLGGMNYPASAVAEEETTAVVFAAPLFRGWVAGNEAIRDFVFTTLANRMAGVMTLVEEITFNKMDGRLAEYLRKKFSNKGRSVKEIQITHEQIAIELGSAREVVSRLLKEFERQGAIELARGRILLKNEKIFKAKS